MSEENKVTDTELENARLKADNDMLLSVVAQMKVTLNRLIDRYITDENCEHA